MRRYVPPQAPPAGPVVLLSINRYERKKDVALAVRAFGRLRRALQPAGLAGRVHLVLAGGYDTRVAENVGYFSELLDVAAEEGLLPDGPGGLSEAAAADVLPGLPAGPPVPYPQVLSSGRAGGLTLIRSFSDEQKAALLRACSAVVYTPAGEHFGIVPLECMAACRPVLAVASGGPTESVVAGRTGWLCPPTPEVRGGGEGARCGRGCARRPVRLRAATGATLQV